MDGAFITGIGRIIVKLCLSTGTLDNVTKCLGLYIVLMKLVFSRWNSVLTRRALAPIGFQD